MNGSHGAALLVVDLQNDFCAGGALAVPNADHVVNAMNRYIAEAAANHLPVYASRDWHPPVSTHFQAYGGPWPTHCVRDTAGARFHPDVQLPATAVVVSKGQDASGPGYSAFEGRMPDGRLFGQELQDRGIGHLYVGGLATVYCVRQSVLDALSAGLRVTVLGDAIAGVNLDESARAIGEMLERGAEITAPSRLAG